MSIDEQVQLKFLKPRAETVRGFCFLECKMNLEDWRNEIDHIDAEIVRLLNRRTRVVRKIGEIKARAGLPARDYEREERVLQSICRSEQGGLRKSAMRRIYSEILRESRRIQESELGAPAARGVET